jgi:hypothetical protein
MTLEKGARHSPLAQSTKPFSIVMACEEPVAAEKAIQICSQVTQQIGAEFETNIQSWLFEKLGNETAMLESAAAAAVADLVVVAVGATRELPLPVKAWIERWLARKSPGETGLAAVMIGTPDQPGTKSTASSYLEHVAKEAGLAFFIARLDLPYPAKPAGEFNHPSEKSRLQKFRYHPEPFSHGGLNE